MGIPAYYGYLIKNYKKIIVQIKKLNKRSDNFYLDSNSIIYNCLVEGEFSKLFIIISQPSIISSLLIVRGGVSLTDVSLKRK